MISIKEVLKRAADYLTQKGIANGRRQAEEVIGDALNLPRMQLYMQFDRPLNEEELQRCRQAVSRRSMREPAQYIKGEVSFLDGTFLVDPAVLIPRQETEILADRIVQALKKENLEGKELWDLCTGSGCLGIIIKKQFPELRVVLSDVSMEALKVAQRNAEKNNVEVTFLLGDLLRPFSGKKAHYVVCNPPYISEEEYQMLEREVKDFEPRVALVGGVDGLDYYRSLAKELSEHMYPQGKIWLEIGTGSGEAVSQLFRENETWKEILWAPDWAGHDRFFEAVLNR